MSLRMQLRRIVIMMIIEYAVPSLALNYPCKEYQIIYESGVHIYLCTCMRNKYLCKSEFAWNVHIQVMLKMTSFSIFNMYELVRTCMAARGIDFKIPRLTGILWIGSQLDQRTVHQLTDRQMHTFPDQMNWQFVQILMYSKFHSKFLVLDTDDVKQKTSLFCIVSRLLFFCFTSSVSGTHLLHELIVNAKHRMDWSYRKPYICLSFNFWKQYLPSLMEHV